MFHGNDSRSIWYKTRVVSGCCKVSSLETVVQFPPVCPKLGIAGHCKPELRTLIRSCTHEPMPYKETQANIRADSLLDELLTEVKRCMDCGLIREGNPREFAYLMIAGSGYEAIMHSLLFNGDLTRSTLLLVQTILGPLVTDKGRAELDRHVQDWDGPACATSILSYMDDILMSDGDAQEGAEGVLDSDRLEAKAPL